jgi:DNA-binding winged helix-turn-helix (wHTH) protein
MASANPTSTRRLVQLGEFELDRSTGELRKGDVKVRLQEQPLKILELLLEQPGELVSREQIQQRLWPDGTFVEFEHSVNAAVKRLREALGDSVDNPRFVETIPRRGYRLIAPVPSPDGCSGAALVTPARVHRRMWKIAVPNLRVLVGLAEAIGVLHRRGKDGQLRSQSLKVFAV